MPPTLPMLACYPHLHTTHASLPSMPASHHSCMPSMKACHPCHLILQFQSTKSPVELNSFLLKFLLCHMVWWEMKLEAFQTRPIFQILLFLWSKTWVVSSLNKHLFDGFENGHPRINFSKCYLYTRYCHSSLSAIYYNGCFNCVWSPYDIIVF